MPLQTGLIAKARRYAGRLVLAPHRVTETLQRIQGIEADLRASRIAAPQPPTPAETPLSPLQIFRGYDERDLGVFEPFRSAGGAPGRPGFITDFLGVRTRCASIYDGARNLDGTTLGLPIPGDFHAETVEWIGLLKSALTARDRFIAMELGAGWAPWLVAGAAAARFRGITDIRLIGVEADVGHFHGMRDHFADNGLDPDAHRLIHGAVGVKAGMARWPVVADPANQWGLRPVKSAEDGGSRVEPDAYLGPLADETVEVRIHAAADLLRQEQHFDLLHVDVQGGEADIIADCLELLQERVHWIVVGTHSRKLDGDVLATLHGGGFVLEHEKPTRFAYARGASELESMTLADGTQVWRNPRLD